MKYGLVNSNQSFNSLIEQPIKSKVCSDFDAF